MSTNITLQITFLLSVVSASSKQPWPLSQSLMVLESGSGHLKTTEGPLRNSPFWGLLFITLRYLNACAWASLVNCKSEAETWQTTCSTLSSHSNPWAMLRRFNSTSGKNKNTQNPSFPGCRSQRDTANHYVSYLCSYLLQAIPVYRAVLSIDTWMNCARLAAKMNLYFTLILFPLLFQLFFNWVLCCYTQAPILHCFLFGRLISLLLSYSTSSAPLSLFNRL